MNKHQETAISHVCYLPEECVQRQFAYPNGTHSIVLTVNAGFE